MISYSAEHERWPDFYSRPTEWYLKAQQVSSLLKDAEELDWMEDHMECLPQADPSRYLRPGTAAPDGDCDGDDSEHSDFQAVPIADEELKDLDLEGGDSLPHERCDEMN